LKELDNEELHNFNSSPNIIRIIMSERNIGRESRSNWGEGNSCSIPLGRPRLKWVDCIKIDLRERGLGGDSREYGNELSGFIKYWEFLSSRVIASQALNTTELINL
jgi:hypothetical protein